MTSWSETSNPWMGAAPPDIALSFIRSKVYLTILHFVKFVRWGVCTPTPPALRKRLSRLRTMEDLQPKPTVSACAAIPSKKHRAASLRSLTLPSLRSQDANRFALAYQNTIVFSSNEISPSHIDKSKKKAKIVKTVDIYSFMAILLVVKSSAPCSQF